MMSATLSTLSPPLARRVQAVLALLRGLPAAQVAAQFCCCRSDLYKWRQRALAVLPAALADQPRGPKQPHNRVAPEQEARVVALCARHPTWSSYQISRCLGPEAPVPRTIQRLRVRHGLPRVPKRATPCTRRVRVLPTAIQQARQLIRVKPFLGPERLAWELQNTAQLQISPATLKRLKRRMHTEAHPPAPAPTWRFYERKHPHSLWHGDCMEKVILSDTGRQAYHLTLLDDYSRGYVFCDLFREVDPRTTIRALVAAMRQWHVIPTAVVFDNGLAFRGKLLEAFCTNLGIELIHTSPRHPQTNGKLERAFRDDMREFYAQYPTWHLDPLRRDLPAYIQYRNTVRGHRALGGQPALTRLQEQHRMALPWVLERLETAARYEMGRKRVPASGALQMFRRQVYLDATLGGQEVTMYETLDGLEIRSADQQGYLLRHYRTWLNRFTWNGGQLLPADLHFEVCGGESCPRIAVAQ
jgi:transposase InsO family protein